MQFHFAEESNKIAAVVRDERELIFDDSLGQFPVGLATQTEVVDVRCLKTSGISDSNQRLMQAFVDEEPQALSSSVLSAKDFGPEPFPPARDDGWDVRAVGTLACTEAPWRSFPC